MKKKMKVKNINTSSISTQKNIKEAFAILMSQKKELSMITVTELVKKAGITRSSFYTHYDNIYDVAKEIQDDTLKLIDFDEDDIESPETIKKYLNKVINYLKNNEEMYRLISASKEVLIFAQKLSKVIYNKIIKLEIIKPENKELKVSFFTDGCVSLFIKYFKGKMNESLDEIGDYIDHVIEEYLLK